MRSKKKTGLDQAQIRVVVADDHPLIRLGVVNALKRHQDILVVGTADNGDEVLHLAQTLQPDVIILDCSMPGLPTLEVVQQIRSLKTAPHILMLTAYAEEAYVVALLKAGVRGYMLKDEFPSSIPIAVRSIHQNKTWLSSVVATMLVDHYQNKKALLAPPDLTRREIELLRLVTIGKTNQEIGDTLGLSSKTVEKYMGTIFVKLRVTTRVEAAVRAVLENLV
jgi:DNA-binding NarL/FixJ family response regulator